MNIVLEGMRGVGKSTLAKSVVSEAIRWGEMAYYVKNDHFKETEKEFDWIEHQLLTNSPNMVYIYDRGGLSEFVYSIIEQRCATSYLFERFSQYKRTLEHTQTYTYLINSRLDIVEDRLRRTSRKEHDLSLTSHLFNLAANMQSENISILENTSTIDAGENLGLILNHIFGS